RLIAPVVEPIRRGRAGPEVEDRREARHVVCGIDQARRREHLASDEEEVRNCPEMYWIDLRGQAMAGAAEILRRRRMHDLVDDLGIPPVALDRRDHDVGAHRDQRRFERRPLHRQRVRDLAVVADPAVDDIAVERHGTIRTTPGSAEQSTSTASPSAGSFVSDADITQGIWYSRLTMPMCESGVPERHTTAVSSSKIGARKVAPASATHAMTPSAVVSISSNTSSGDVSLRQDPRTGSASKTRVPLPISLTAMECSRAATITIST